MREDIGSGLFLVHILLILDLVHRRLNEAVDKRLHLMRGVLGFLVAGHPVHLLKSGPFHTVPLRLVELDRKIITNAMFHRSHLAFDTLTKEELRGRVYGKSEEDGLDVCLLGPAGVVDGQSHHGLLEMTFLQLQLADLFTRELGT